MEYMMGITLVVLMLTAVGALLTWQKSSKSRNADETARIAELEALLHERDSMLAVAGERIRNMESQIAALTVRLETQERARQQFEEALRNESALRSAAVEKAERLPEYEKALADRDIRLRAQAEENGALRAELAEMKTLREEEGKASAEKLAFLEQARERLADAFKALSHQALHQNSETFATLMKGTIEEFQKGAKADLDSRQKAIDTLVKPLAESLQKVDAEVKEMEKNRVAAYTSLHEQLKVVMETSGKLQHETTNLVRALRSPAARGRWGEIQLQRVVEMAGMTEYCDFTQQVHAENEERRLRPDMVVRLPNNRNIVVDSKAPLEAYLTALEATDDGARLAALKDHARQVRAHLTNLGSKNYWDSIKPSPDFVVLFLPGEPFFSAALEQDPGLIEYGLERQVMMATPTTLIGLLKAISYGWRQEQLARNAQAICELGRTLHERIRTFLNHFDGVRKGLESAANAYNSAVGALESRVLVSARKFEELGAAGKSGELPPTQDITSSIRQLHTDSLPENTE